MSVLGRILCWADSHDRRIISVSEPMRVRYPWQTFGRLTTLIVSKCSRCGSLVTAEIDGAWTAEQLGVRAALARGE